MRFFKKYTIKFSDFSVRFYYVRTRDGIENMVNKIKEFLSKTSLIITEMIETTYIECCTCGIYKPQGEMNLMIDNINMMMCYCVECDDTLDPIRKEECERE